MLCQREAVFELVFLTYMLFDLFFKLFLTKFQFSHNIDTPPLSRSKAYYLLVCAEVLRPVKATSCAACEYMYCTMSLLNMSARKASLTFGNCVSLAGHRTLLCREKRPHCRPRSQSYLLLEADRTAPWPNAVASSSAAMCRLVNPDWSLQKMN